MTYPDVTLTDPWTHAQEVSEVDLYSDVTVPLNAIVPRVSDTGFTAPTLGNSWVNSGGANEVAGYRLKAGVVWLSGLIKSGTTGTTIFTLPVGMRPLGTLSFVVADSGGSAIMTVSSAGAVQLTLILTGTNGALSLNGIQFVAEQ